MLTRYDVRYNCFRMKNGIQPKSPEIIEILTPLVEAKRFAWKDFADKWDVVVKNGEVIVIASVKDINAVSEVCTKRAMVEQHGLAVEWTAEEQSIIDMVESQFLDGIMSWKNYRQTWNIRFDHETNKIVTNVIREKTQLDVTEEMIDKKLKEAMEASKMVNDSVQNTLVARPMTEEEVEKYVNKTKTSRKNNK